MSWFRSKESESLDSGFWTHLNSQTGWQEIMRRSETRPQVIFKHSTRCIISKMVLRNFENELTTHEPEDFHLLDLITYREVSNLIETELKELHQSPQLIVVHKKRAVYNRSHQSISASDVEKVITSLVT